MANITINSFHCSEETTSGWSARRRRLRRKRFSDEVLIVVGAFPMNADGAYINNGEFQHRTATGVDSNEDHLFSPPIEFNFDPRLAPHVQVRVWGFELDGAGTTSSLGQTQAAEIESFMRFDVRPGVVPDYNPMPTPDLGGRIGAKDHDLILADMWQVNTNRPLRAGSNPVVRAPGRRGVLDVPAWLDRHGIEREISVFAGRGDQRIERRSYRSPSERSDYRFDVRYSA